MTMVSFKKLGCLSAVSMMMAATAHAEVTVNVPEEISMHVVNLDKAKVEGSLFSSTKQLTLPDGLNQIAFRYSQNFVHRNDAKRVYSPLIIMKFEAADKELDFTLPKYRNDTEAQRNIEQFQWQLVEHNTQQPIDAITDSIAVSGFVLGQSFSEEVEKYNKQGGKAAVGLTYVTVAQPQTTTATESATSSVATTANTATTAAVTSAAPVVKTQIVDAQAAPQNGVLGGLQSLYLQASEQERKAFRRWIIDQE